MDYLDNQTMQIRVTRNTTTLATSGYEVHCQTCNQPFRMHQKKIKWRLKYMFDNRNVAGSHWLEHCQRCFSITIESWRQQLNTVNIAPIMEE